MFTQWSPNTDSRCITSVWYVYTVISKHGLTMHYFCMVCLHSDRCSFMFSRWCTYCTMCMRLGHWSWSYDLDWKFGAMYCWCLCLLSIWILAMTFKPSGKSDLPLFIGQIICFLLKQPLITGAVMWTQSVWLKIYNCLLYCIITTCWTMFQTY